MAKFYGMIGFGVEEETSPGVWDLAIVERPYFGEITREALNVVAGQTVLGESTNRNAFRILADGYATENFTAMKYILWLGRYYEITQVILEQRPRITVRIGGVYHGPTYKAGTTPVGP